MSITKTKYTYTGPYFNKGFLAPSGKLYNPSKMLDKEIEEFIKKFPETKKWWKIKVQKD